MTDLDHEIKEWIMRAKNEGFSFILVLKDLTDKDYFPVFVKEERMLVTEKKKWVSASRCQIVQQIKVQ